MSFADRNSSIKFAGHERIYALVGEKVTRVSFEEWAVRILIAEIELVIDAEWVLWDRNGIQIDNSQELIDRKDFKLWNIVGKIVNQISISDDNLPILQLNFDNESSLIIKPNDDNFEDWSFVACDSSFRLVCNGGL